MDDKRLDNDLKLLYTGQMKALGKEYDEAIEYFNKILRKERKKEKTQSKVEIIAKYLKKIILINEGYFVYLEKLKDDYISSLKERDFVKAFYLIQEMVELDPSNAEYRLMYAQSSLRIDHPYLAIKEITHTLALKPQEGIFNNALLTMGQSLHHVWWYNMHYNENIEPAFEKMGIGDLKRAIDELHKLLKQPNISAETKRQAEIMIHRCRQLILLVIEMRHRKHG